MNFLKNNWKNLLTFLSSEQRNIYKTSVFLMMLLIITKLSGFLYNAVLAKILGASRPLDMFFIANTIPEILGNLILHGVISSAFIPILIKSLKNEGHANFLKLFNTLLNFSLLCFSAFAILIIAIANWAIPYLLNVIEPQTPFTTEEVNLIIRMLRLLLIPQIILGISTFCSSYLNIHHRFLIPQVSPLFYNFGRILGALILVPILGGIEGLVWGTILGSLLHLFIQIPIIKTLGIKHSFEIDTSNIYFKEALKIGFPRIIGIATEHILQGVNKFIAIRFIVGSVSSLEFATRLVVIPLSLFGMPFAIASFPTLAKYYQAREYNYFIELFNKLLNQILFLTIPATVIILVLRIPLVRLFFGIFGGEFDFQSTYLTAWTVAFFSIGLPFESVRTLIYRSFYAANNTTYPLLAAFFTLTTGIITKILLTNYFSHFDILDVNALHINPSFLFEKSSGKAAIGGLALSSSIVFTLEFFLLLFIFNKKILPINIKQIFKSIIKKYIAGFIMFISVFIVFKIWGNSPLQERTIFLTLFVSITFFVGFCSYVGMCLIMRIPETAIATNFIKNIFQRFPFDKYSN